MNVTHLSEFKSVFDSFVLNLQKNNLIQHRYLLFLNSIDNDETLVRFFLTQTSPWEKEILSKDTLFIKNLKLIDSEKVNANDLENLLEYLRVLYLHAFRCCKNS